MSNCWNVNFPFLLNHLVKKGRFTNRYICDTFKLLFCTNSASRKKSKFSIYKKCTDYNLCMPMHVLLPKVSPLYAPLKSCQFPSLSAFSFSLLRQKKLGALLPFWRNTTNLLTSRHTSDLAIFIGMTLIYCGSMKEKRPLIVRTTTQEQVRLQRIGKRGTEGQRKKRMARKRWEMREVAADGWAAMLPVLL